MSHEASDKQNDQACAHKKNGQVTVFLQYWSVPDFIDTGLGCQIG
jgi:hypothetical protein